MVNRDLPDMRKSYKRAKLNRHDLDANPIEQFKSWLKQAMDSDVHEPNAMSLATVDAKGKPSNRIVLLKEVDHGFIFYTNYDSNKGHHIHRCHHAAANFWWDKLERQVRIEGQVEKVDSKKSDDYFLSRPRGSQIGAIVSPQSCIIDSYDYLLDQKNKLDGKNLKRPENWGGYRIIPRRFEFWQGRENRLHDRFVYELDETDLNWVINRLAP